MRNSAHIEGFLQDSEDYFDTLPSMSHEEYERLLGTNAQPRSEEERHATRDLLERARKEMEERYGGTIESNW